MSVLRTVLRQGLEFGTRRLPYSCRRLSSVKQSEQVLVKCPDSAAQFLDQYDTILLDCDGVLWQVDHMTPLPGIAQAIQKLQALGKKLVYVTNNSIVSRQQLVKKFKNYDIDADVDAVIGNAFAAAWYLNENIGQKGKVYVVGSQGMKDELDVLGIENFGVGPDPDSPSWDVEDMLKMKFEDNVKAVLIGFDEFMNFNKIYKAASYLTYPECHFIATNYVEKGFSIAPNRRQPVTGTMVTAVAGVAQREPVVIGKPTSIMYDCIKHKHPEIDWKRSVFVGDSLRADIAFAKNIGIDSALVLSGAATLEMMKQLPQFTPNYILGSLADIV